MAGQIFNVLVLLVDNFRQLLALDHLLVDVHGDPVAEIGQLGGISTHNLGDRRTPGRGGDNKFISQGLDKCRLLSTKSPRGG